MTGNLLSDTTWYLKKVWTAETGIRFFCLRSQKNLAPYQWDVIQHVQIGAAEDATWMGWAAKMEAPRPLVNHPSIPQPSNLQTFKLQPNKPNKLQETHLRQRQTTTWWSCHAKVSLPSPKLTPKILSPRGRTSSGAMMPSAAPRAPRHCSNYAL